MAMLTQTLPMRSLECPAGACREQARAWARGSWTAFAAGIAAGGLAAGALALFAAGAAAPSAARASAEQEASAARWAAVVREHAPREIPREWRYEIEGVNVEGMFRKQR
jgi:hypothetical protein